MHHYISNIVLHFYVNITCHSICCWTRQTIMVSIIQDDLQLKRFVNLSAVQQKFTKSFTMVLQVTNCIFWLVSKIIKNTNSHLYVNHRLYQALCIMSAHKEDTLVAPLQQGADLHICQSLVWCHGNIYIIHELTGLWMDIAHMGYIKQNK